MSAVRDVLVLHAQGAESDEYLLVEHTPFKIGRHSNNDLRLTSSDASGLHAKLVHENGQWWVVDNKSTNGTFINGERLHTRSTLRAGDILHFATNGFEVIPEGEWSADTHGGVATQVLTGADYVQGMVALHHIVSERRAFSVFQPVIDLRTGETFGWESLGRGAWNKPLDPGPLFGLAKKNKVESELSECMRESAIHCALCRHCWPEQSKSHLFFNLNPDEARVDRYTEMLRVLSGSELMRWYHVVLEIHESLVADTESMKRLVQSAREAGLLVAYDDFGAGQSRLPDLLNVPPDFLKLDRSLVTNLATERVKRNLVKAVVDACLDLGVKTLAEGIETEEEHQACLDLDVELGQGYLLCRPQAPFKLFSTDADSLPGHCPYVKLDIIDPYR